jgi:excinuclease ABC subunit C
MRRKFKLRGCRPLHPNESDYRHCLYGNLQHCTAPCIANVTREQYLEQVRAGIGFLEGHTEELRSELESEMRKAAANLDFEKAAQLRDALEDLKRTTLKTEKFERIPYTLPVAVHPESDLRELGRLLGLAEPPARIEGFDISNISGTFIVSSMVSFWHGRPDRSNYRRFRMKTVSTQDDFASMAETIQRRYSRLKRELQDSTTPTLASTPLEQEDSVEDSPEDSLPAEGIVAESPERPWIPKISAGPRLPDLILIDGGKGQLNMACAELAKLGLSHIPILGLAKEFEEIHLPGEKNPLRPGLDSAAVKLLQRVRDEAHRFANTYNAQLRLKKISESILDEFPGIGDARKKALLRRFGSIQRLRIAPIHEIEQVDGFGGTMAQALKRFLEARKDS